MKLAWGGNRVVLNELEATLIDILVLENYHVADNKQKNKKLKIKNQSENFRNRGAEKNCYKIK